jgi:hypothetical protein
MMLLFIILCLAAFALSFGTVSPLVFLMRDKSRLKLHATHTLLHGPHVFASPLVSLIALTQLPKVGLLPFMVLVLLTFFSFGWFIPTLSSRIV